MPGSSTWTAVRRGQQPRLRRAGAISPPGRARRWQQWLAGWRSRASIRSPEIDALPQGIAVFHVEQLQVPQLDAERCIVWMRYAGRQYCSLIATTFF